MQITVRPLKAEDTAVLDAAVQRTFRVLSEPVFFRSVCALFRPSVNAVDVVLEGPDTRRFLHRAESWQDCPRGVHVTFFIVNRGSICFCLPPAVTLQQAVTAFPMVRACNTVWPRWPAGRPAHRRLALRRVSTGRSAAPSRAGCAAAP